MNKIETLTHITNVKKKKMVLIALIRIVSLILLLRWGTHLLLLPLLKKEAIFNSRWRIAARAFGGNHVNLLGVSKRERTECTIFLTRLPQTLAVYGSEYWTWIVAFAVSTCEMAVAVVEWCEWCERHICIIGENCEMTDSGCDTEGMTN